VSADWESVPYAGDAGDAEPYRPAKRRAKSAKDLAEEAMAARRFVQNAAGIIYEYDRDRGHWIERSKATMRSLMLEYGGRSARLRDEMIAHIGAACHDPELAWGRVGPHEVAVRNGVVDVTTGAVRPHAPEDMLDSVIPHDYDPGLSPAQAAPTWFQCLDDWFGDAGDKYDLLQEFFGYLLASHAHYKAALVLYGESNTGKSVICEVAQRLVGEGAVCQLGVEYMDDPVVRAVIKHKRLNVITELTADAMIKDGGFKTLVSTEEPVLINEKFHPAEVYRPIAKHLIACNTLPDVSDRTMATYNRLKIIPFDRPVPPSRQNPRLAERIAAEMPGVLAWAIEGARRLYEAAGRFTEVADAAELVSDYRTMANPVRAFVEEEMIEEAGSAEALSTLVKRFNLWYGGRAIDVRRLGKMLRQAGFEVGLVRIKGGGVAKALKGYYLRTIRTHERELEPG